MSASALALPPSLLSSEHGRQLLRLADELSADALWWISGYTAGLAQARVSTPPATLVAANAPQLESAPALTVIYGSQTGNSRRVAEQLTQQLQEKGFEVRLLRADTYAHRELTSERHLLLVISTQGDGDPPDDARGLVEHLLGKRAPKLPDLRYAVLGLGDSSYPQFCAIGRRLDERLAELGATRWLPRGDADLDIETVSAPWLQQVVSAAQALRPAQMLATVTPLRSPAAAAPVHDRSRPFAAPVLGNQRITGRGSDRDIRHLELSLADSGLHYEPGDALGVWPGNPPRLIEAVVEALRLPADEVVSHDGKDLPLRQWLRDKREITRLSRPFLLKHAQRADNEALDRLLAPEQSAALTALLAGQQLIDVLRAYPASWTAQDFVAALRPLTPRLYSIASSRKHVGDEAHLAVAHVQYTVGDELRWGAASHFLASAQNEQHLPVFVEANERFRLPADGSRDIVMIGPGTGVAPFRGFVQERAIVGASGRNWLLFGNPHVRSDFLYQTEWQDALRRGQLHRLDLAFSRDGGPTAPRTYVQHRLLEQGQSLYRWLQDGAHLYVCGATAMARDVHAALATVIAEHGGFDIEDAREQLNTLQSQGRYARDVY